MRARVPGERQKKMNPALARVAGRAEARAILEREEEEYSKEHDAMVMWMMHRCFGFGRARLVRFWRFLFREHARMKDRYGMEGKADMLWLYRRMLREEVGIDMDALYTEAMDPDADPGGGDGDEA